VTFQKKYLNHDITGGNGGWANEKTRLTTSHCGPLIASAVKYVNYLNALRTYPVINEIVANWKSAGV